MKRHPQEGVAYLVEMAMADATTAKWKLRDGDPHRAALLLRRAQAALCRAEVRLLTMAREDRRQDAQAPGEAGHHDEGKRAGDPAAGAMVAGSRGARRGRP